MVDTRRGHGANTRRHEAQTHLSRTRELAVERMYLDAVKRGEEKGALTRIAAELGISRVTAWKLHKRASAALPPAIEHEASKIRDAIIGRNEAARARLDKLEAALWEQWERSQHPGERVDTAGHDDQGRLIKRTWTRRAAVVDAEGKPIPGIGRDKADAAFSAQLAQIENTRLALDKELRELMGVDAPTKSQTENVNVDLSQLSDEQLARLEKGEPLAAVLRTGNAA